MLYKAEEHEILNNLYFICKNLSLNCIGHCLSSKGNVLFDSSSFLKVLYKNLKDNPYSFLLSIFITEIAGLRDKTKLFAFMVFYLYRYRAQLDSSFDIANNSVLEPISYESVLELIDNSEDKWIYDSFLKEISLNSYVQFIEDEELRVKILKGSYISGEGLYNNLIEVYVLVSYIELKDYKKLISICEYIKSSNKCLYIISPYIDSSIISLLDKNLGKLWTYTISKTSFDIYKDYAAICGAVLIDINNQDNIGVYHLGYIEELESRSSYSIIKPSSNGNITTLNRLNDIESSFDYNRRRANILGQLVFLYGNSSILEYRILIDLIALLNKDRNNLYIFSTKPREKPREELNTIDLCIQKAVSRLGNCNKETYNLVTDKEEIQLLVDKALSLVKLLDSISFINKKV